jgi:hypothetical protein
LQGRSTWRVAFATMQTRPTATKADPIARTGSMAHEYLWVGALEEGRPLLKNEAKLRSPSRPDSEAIMERIQW